MSLDISTILHEVVESACALTGARCGAIMTIDEAGRVQKYNSFGITQEQNRQLLAWPDGPKFFEHLRQLPGPVCGGEADAVPVPEQTNVVGPAVGGYVQV